MQNRDDILEGARCLRPLLLQFTGPAAEEIDRKLADLLAASHHAKVDNQILELVAQRDSTRQWMREFLEVKKSQNAGERDEQFQRFVSRYFAPPPGDPEPVAAMRFECPRGDYVWYQHAAGINPPQCPTHHLTLVRGR